MMFNCAVKLAITLKGLTLFLHMGFIVYLKIREVNTSLPGRLLCFTLFNGTSEAAYIQGGIKY